MDMSNARPADHDASPLTTNHHGTSYPRSEPTATARKAERTQHSRYVASTYFFVAFWAALVTLPAFSILTTDLMTPTATVWRCIQ